MKDRRIGGYSGFEIHCPNGKTIRVELESSMITPEKNVKSEYLLEMVEDFKRIIADRGSDNVGFAMANEFAENERQGAVGHWVYIGGTGFAFHSAANHKDINAGIAAMVKAFESVAVKVNTIITPPRDAVVVNKSGNA